MAKNYYKYSYDEYGNRIGEPELNYINSPDPTTVLMNQLYQTYNNQYLNPYEPSEDLNDRYLAWVRDAERRGVDPWQSTAPEDVAKRNVFSAFRATPSASIPSQQKKEGRGLLGAIFDAYDYVFGPSEEEKRRSQQIKSQLYNAYNEEPMKRRKKEDFTWGRDYGIQDLKDGISSGVLVLEGNDVFRRKGKSRETLPIATITVGGYIKGVKLDRTDAGEDINNPYRQDITPYAKRRTEVQPTAEELDKKNNATGFLQGLAGQLSPHLLLNKTANLVADIFDTNYQHISPYDYRGTQGSSRESAKQWGETAGMLGTAITSGGGGVRLASRFLPNAKRMLSLGGALGGAAPFIPEYTRQAVAGEITPEAAIGKSLIDIGTGYGSMRVAEKLLGKLGAPTLFEAIAPNVEMPLSAGLSKPQFYTKFLGGSALRQAPYTAGQAISHTMIDASQQGREPTAGELMTNAGFALGFGTIMDVAMNFAAPAPVVGAKYRNEARAKAENAQAIINYIAKMNDVPNNPYKARYTPEQIVTELMRSGAMKKASPGTAEYQSALDLVNHVGEFNRTYGDPGNWRVEAHVTDKGDMVPVLTPKERPQDPNAKVNLSDDDIFTVDQDGTIRYKQEYVDGIGATMERIGNDPAQNKDKGFSAISEFFEKVGSKRAFNGIPDEEGNVTNRGAQEIIDTYRRLTGAKPEDLKNVSQQDMVQTLMRAARGEHVPHYMATDPFATPASDELIGATLRMTDIPANERVRLNIIANAERGTLMKSAQGAYHKALTGKEPGDMTDPEAYNALLEIGKALDVVKIDDTTGQIKGGAPEPAKLVDGIKKKLGTIPASDAKQMLNSYANQKGWGDVAENMPPPIRPQDGGAEFIPVESPVSAEVGQVLFKDRVGVDAEPTGIAGEPVAPMPRPDIPGPNDVVAPVIPRPVADQAQGEMFPDNFEQMLPTPFTEGGQQFRQEEMFPEMIYPAESPTNVLAKQMGMRPAALEAQLAKGKTVPEIAAMREAAMQQAAERRATVGRYRETRRQLNAQEKTYNEYMSEKSGQLKEIRKIPDANERLAKSAELLDELNNTLPPIDEVDAAMRRVDPSNITEGTRQMVETHRAVHNQVVRSIRDVQSNIKTMQEAASGGLPEKFSWRKAATAPDKDMRAKIDEVKSIGDKADAENFDRVVAANAVREFVKENDIKGVTVTTKDGGRQINKLSVRDGGPDLGIALRQKGVPEEISKQFDGIGNNYNVSMTPNQMKAWKGLLGLGTMTPARKGIAAAMVRAAAAQNTKNNLYGVLGIMGPLLPDDDRENSAWDWFRYSVGMAGIAAAGLSGMAVVKNMHVRNMQDPVHAVNPGHIDQGRKARGLAKGEQVQANLWNSKAVQDAPAHKRAALVAKYEKEIRDSWVKPVSGDLDSHAARSGYAKDDASTKVLKNMLEGKGQGDLHVKEIVNLQRKHEKDVGSKENVDLFYLAHMRMNKRILEAELAGNTALAIKLKRKYSTDAGVAEALREASFDQKFSKTALSEQQALDLAQKGLKTYRDLVKARKVGEIRAQLWERRHIDISELPKRITELNQKKRDVVSQMDDASQRIKVLREAIKSKEKAMILAEAYAGQPDKAMKKELEQLRSSVKTIEKEIDGLSRIDLASINKSLREYNEARRVLAIQDDWYVPLKYDWHKEGGEHYWTTFREVYGVKKGQDITWPEKPAGESGMKIRKHFATTSEGPRDKWIANFLKEHNAEDYYEGGQRRPGMYVMDAVDTFGNKIMVGGKQKRVLVKMDTGDTRELQYYMKKNWDEMQRMVRDMVANYGNPDWMKANYKTSAKNIDIIAQSMNDKVNGIAGANGSHLAYAANEVNAAIKGLHGEAQSRANAIYQLQELMDSMVMPGVPFLKKTRNYSGWEPTNVAELRQYQNYWVTHADKYLKNSLMKGYGAKEIIANLKDFQLKGQFQHADYKYLNDMLGRFKSDAELGNPDAGFWKSGVAKFTAYGQSYEVPLYKVVSAAQAGISSSLLALNALSGFKNRLQSDVGLVGAGTHFMGLGNTLKYGAQAKLINKAKVPKLLAKHMFGAEEKLTFGDNPIASEVYEILRKDGTFAQSPFGHTSFVKGQKMEHVRDKGMILTKIAEFMNRSDSAMTYVLWDVAENMPKGLTGQARADYVKDLAGRARMFSSLVNGSFALPLRGKLEGAIASNWMARSMMMFMSPQLRQLYNAGNYAAYALRGMGLNRNAPVMARQIAPALAFLGGSLLLSGIAYTPFVGAALSIAEEIAGWTDTNKLDDKKYDRSFWEKSWDSLTDTFGVPRDKANEIRDILSKGALSWALNKALGDVGLPGKDFSWDEAFGGYIDPVLISYMLKAGSKLFESDKALGERMVNTWYEMLPVFVKRTFAAGKQLIAGNYLDKNGQKIAGKFGYGDAAMWVMFGRNYDMAMEQMRNVTDVNPMRTPFAAKEYMKKVIKMDGIKYSGRDQGKIERSIMDAKNGIWKVGSELQKELADASDSLAPTKEAALAKMDAFLEGKDVNEVLDYFANRDMRSFQQFMRYPGSKILPAPEDRPSLVNENISQLKSRLRNYVNDYYNTGAASAVIQKMLIHTMDNAPKVTFTWDKLPSPTGRRVADYPLEEQGYLFALSRLYKEMQDEGYNYGPKIPRRRR